MNSDDILDNPIRTLWPWILLTVFGTCLLWFLFLMFMHWNLGNMKMLGVTSSELFLWPYHVAMQGQPNLDEVLSSLLCSGITIVICTAPVAIATIILRNRNPPKDVVIAWLLTLTFVSCSMYCVMGLAWVMRGV